LVACLITSEMDNGATMTNAFIRLITRGLG